MNKAKEVLREHGYYCASVHGCSMNPLLLNHRDSVFVELTDSFKKYDVVLFERKSGQLVLHRIIKCDGEYFVISGDNDLLKERVHFSRILGKRTEFSRKGKEHNVFEPWYVIYSRVWNFSFITKRILIFIYRVLSWIKRKL